MLLRLLSALSTASATTTALPISVTLEKLCGSRFRRVFDRGDAFKAAKTHTETLHHSEISQVL